MHRNAFWPNLHEGNYELTLLKGDILHYCQGLIEFLQENSKLVASIHTDVPGHRLFRGVQPFGISGPYIKYTATRNHKKILMFWVTLWFCIGPHSKPSWATGWTPLFKILFLERTPNERHLCHLNHIAKNTAQGSATVVDGQQCRQRNKVIKLGHLPLNSQRWPSSALGVRLQSMLTVSPRASMA